MLRLVAEWLQEPGAEGHRREHHTGHREVQVKGRGGCLEGDIQMEERPGEGRKEVPGSMRGVGLASGILLKFNITQTPSPSTIQSSTQYQGYIGLICT